MQSFNSAQSFRGVPLLAETYRPGDCGILHYRVEDTYTKDLAPQRTDITPKALSDETFRFQPNRLPFTLFFLGVQSAAFLTIIV